MPGLSEKLKRLLEALALADAGEMLLPRDKDRVLESCRHQAATSLPETPPPLGMCNLSRTGRSVVLGIDHQLLQSSLAYALGACTRLNAALIMLCSNGTRTEDLLAPHRETLSAAGIDWSIETLASDRPRAVFDYLQNHAGVLFAVTSGNDPVAMLVQPSGKGARKNPPVPIVVISDHSQKQPEPLEYRRFRRTKNRN